MAINLKRNYSEGKFYRSKAGKKFKVFEKLGLDGQWIGVEIDGTDVPLVEFWDDWGRTRDNSADHDLVAEWEEIIDASDWWVYYIWNDGSTVFRSDDIFLDKDTAKRAAAQGNGDWDNVAIAPLGSTKLERVK
jgi:hypothetical protein